MPEPILIVTAAPCPDCEASLVRATHCDACRGTGRALVSAETLLAPIRGPFRRVRMDPAPPNAQE